MRATTREDEPVVLKVQFPHRESEHEADALDAWRGEGAVRLLERDVERQAILLERCEPGSPLSAIGMDPGIDVLIDLLPRLWIPVDGPFRALGEEAAWWAGDLEGEFQGAGRPFARRLLDIALDALRELPRSEGEQPVLLHQDLHGDNVLRASREPWLVIDPKPLAGERAFSVAPIVRSHEFGRSREAVIRRLDRLTAELTLDRDRARRWTIAQTVAWAFDRGGADPWHVAIAEWLAEGL